MSSSLSKPVHFHIGVATASIAAITFVAIAAALKSPLALMATTSSLLAFTGVLLAWVHSTLLRSAQHSNPQSDPAANPPLFSSTPSLHRHTRALQLFEKWWAPITTALAALFSLLSIFYILKSLFAIPSTAPQSEPPPFLPTLVGLQCILALIGFQLGRYLLALGQSAPHTPLTPAARSFLWMVTVLTLHALANSLSLAGYPQTQSIAAIALALPTFLAGTELLFHVLLDLYRPRTSGHSDYWIYESRLLGLAAQPGNVLAGATHALDYQFGFKVSQTWFFQWLQGSLLGLLLIQGAIVRAASSWFMVEPHQQAIVERWGTIQTNRSPASPGLHLKWPWPIESAHLHNVRGVRHFNIGFITDPKFEAERTLLWTKSHYLEELNLLVASPDDALTAQASSETGTSSAAPVNLITVSIPVQYDITNLLHWATLHRDPEQLLEQIATSEVIQHLVGIDMPKLMASGRRESAAWLKARIQNRATEERLGIQILAVGLQDIHPPVQVAAAFEAVIGSEQERETAILRAEEYLWGQIPLAQANAERTRQLSLAQSSNILHSAQGRSMQFLNQMTAAHLSPSLYRQHSYLEALAVSMTNTRKIFLSRTNHTPDIWINLEDKLRTDLLDMPVTTTPTPENPPSQSNP